MPAAPQHTRGPTPSVATGEAGEPRPARLPGRLIRAAPAALTRALPGERLLWAQPCLATSGPMWHRDAPRLGRRHSGLRRPWRQWVPPLEAVGAPHRPHPHRPRPTAEACLSGSGAATSRRCHTPKVLRRPPPHGRGSWRGSGVRCRVLQGHKRPATHIGGSRGTCLSLSGFRPSESVYTADLSLASTNVSLWFVSCSLAFGNGEASRGTLSSRPETRSAWHPDALEAEQSPGRLPSAPRGSYCGLGPSTCPSRCGLRGEWMRACAGVGVPVGTAGRWAPLLSAEADALGVNSSCAHSCLL